MSTPPEIPASATKAGPKPPKRRTRPSTNATDNAADRTSSEGPPTIASTADAPAPPRRGRRGAGAAAGAVPSAAAAAADAPVTDRDKPAEPATTDTAKPKRAAGAGPSAATRAPSTPKTGRGSESTKSTPPASGPKPPAPPAKDTVTPDAKDKAAPEAKDTKDTKDTKDATKDATKPATKPDPSPVAAAVSEADAEAVLVEEPTPVPKARRFGVSRRASSASTSTAAVAAALPATPTPAAVVGPTVITTGATGAVRSDRHYRQTVSKVDLWSVTKLSLCFYLSAMFVTVVAFVALWIIADAAGIIHSVEKFLGDLLSAKNFHFLSATVLRGAIVVGLVVVALQVVITVIAASFYNIFAELFGGIEITVKEEVSAE